jgi:hypothetical protein
MMWSRSWGIRGNEVSGVARVRRAFRVSFPKGEDAMHEPDPNHHLWRNGRLWWVAFTVHLPGWQKERIRLSLGTADLAEARRARDELLRRYPQTRDCELSLRLAPPRPRRRKGGRRLPLATRGSGATAVCRVGPAALGTVEG